MKARHFLYLIPILLIGISNYNCKKDILTPPPTPIDTLSLTQIEKDSILTGGNNEVMRILSTANYDDSLILRKQSREVRPDPEDTVLFRLVRRMYYTLKATSGGVGIAAPQVGINRDIIWVKRLDKYPTTYEYYLNPKIVFYSSQPIIFNGDGCLSIPGLSGNTNRFSYVMIEYDLLDGSHHEELVDGYSGTNFTAVIFQHEIDHLNGILFIDRLVSKGKLSRVAEIDAVDLFTM